MKKKSSAIDSLYIDKKQSTQDIDHPDEKELLAIVKTEPDCLDQEKDSIDNTVDSKIYKS